MFVLTCLALVSWANYMPVEASEILVVAPIPAYSHFTIAFTLAEKLAEKGHQVTSINPFPQATPIPNYHDISVEGNVKAFEEHQKKLFSRNSKGVLDNLTALFDLIHALNNITLSNVQNLISSKRKFDVVIIEHFLNDVFIGLGKVFNTPVVLIASMPPNPMNNYVFHNPSPASYVPGSGGTLTKHMDFWQRMENLAMLTVFKLMIKFYYFPKQNELVRQYIDTNLDIETVLKDVSLLLTNSHFSVTNAVPVLPSIIEIGGYHIVNKKLPKSLQEYLDNAPEGVILFSMGSNLKSKDLKPEVRDGVLEAFSKLKQKVLWKFETELPNTPENVRIMKWIPQQDVLAHPNVKVFITHGGLLSNIEAVYFGVPLIGIPVFGDQRHNVAEAVANEYAIGIELNDLSEKTLSEALNKILTNNKYEINVSKRSTIMRDQPMKPIDSAIYWVEHVIRHKGAPHLKSAAVDLTFIERELIDVFLFLLFALIAILTIICIVLRKIARLCSSADFETLPKHIKHKSS